MTALTSTRPRSAQGAFIGSNTSLVAPVKIGDGAYIGSGSVITKDVAADALALERGEQTTARAGPSDSGDGKAQDRESARADDSRFR